MSSIDAVIARARRPGSFSERQTFTLARNRAIQKMRHFALADPHFYVLELVQASIASGATWVTIEADQDSFTLSYVGGGFPEAGLQNLFDFLFASKERTEFAALRALALGVNAILLFHPTRVVIESGDGTLPGTTRMELKTGDDQLVIGRPDQPLAGTFIRVEGMQRSKMSRELQLSIAGDGQDEQAVIEHRCICAPVPIIFNSEALFGHSTQRIPRTFGYRRQIDFDEGDLFGSLGLQPLGGRPSFRLLTYGVWIESIEHSLLGGAPLGGTINFDVLHKSADHGRIVRDERLEDLWIRIRPYAEMLLRGTQTVKDAYEVSIFGGMRLPSKQLRLFLREVGKVVIIPPSVGEGTAQAERALRIAHALDAELLTARSEQLDRLRVLAGRDVTIVTPDVNSEVDLAVYTSPTAEEPPRPWLLTPIDGPPMTTSELIDALIGPAGAPAATARGDDEAGEDYQADADTVDEPRALLEHILGRRGEITTRVYTPANASGTSSLRVRLTTCDREVACVPVVSAHSGHLITAELPGLRPDLLKAADNLDEMTAGAIARHLAETLRDASRRALYGLDPETVAPSTPQAHLALSAIQRRSVVRMRRQGGRAVVTIDAIDEIEGLDLHGLRLLRTLSGGELSVRELPELLSAGHGLLYGVIPEVEADLRGLDTTRILDLDGESERLLIAIVGESAYVRVDARDVLAEHAGIRVRDLALGLRDYPDHPLLLEADDPAFLTPEAIAAAEEALTTKLLHLYLEPPEGMEPALAEELRRQACRHIQRYLCRAIQAGADEPLGSGLPLVFAPDGSGYNFRELLEAFAVHGTLVAHYDHGALPPAVDQILRSPPGSPPPHELLVSPFLFNLLGELGTLALPFDFALDETAAKGRQEAPPEETFLASVELREGGLRGRLGVPLVAPEAARIVLLDPSLRVRHALPGIADDFGVVGALQLEVASSGEDFERLFAPIRRGAEAALGALARRLPEFEPGSIEQTRALTVLLEHAGRSLSLVASPSGAISPSTATEIAAQVLGIPLFPGPHGLPISASSILRALAREVRRRPGQAVAGVDVVAAERLDEPRRTWLEKHVHSAKIARPSAHSRPHVASENVTTKAPRAFDEMTLCATISGWIEALRPDAALSAEVPGGRSPVYIANEVWEDAPHRPAYVTPTGGTSAHIYLNTEHWQVRWAMAKGEDDPRPIAWLLLAVYAEINALLGAVTNDHEQEFQRRVSAALRERRLQPIAPPPMSA